MTNEQMNFINEQLKFHGFPQVDTEYLQKFSGSTEFELTVQVWFGKDRVEAILLFRLSEHYGVHFLHRHTVTIRARSQTFYLFKNKGGTLKEAYKLLCGRAVFKKQQSKEQEVYYVWLQLDLNEPD